MSNFKKILKRITLLLLGCLFVKASGSSPNLLPQKNGFSTLLISIPKTGTWLLEQCFRLLTNKTNSLWRLQSSLLQPYVEDPQVLPYAIQLFNPSTRMFNTCTNLGSEEFLITHLTYDKIYEDMLLEKDFKIIFLIRDPRDQLISRVYYTQRYPSIFSGLQHLSFDELLSGYMGIDALPEQNFEDLLISHIGYSHTPHYKAISHIVKFYEAFLPWMHVRNCYTVRFEDLVGEQGGGSLKAQLQEIINIANHTGTPLASKHLIEVAQKSFGFPSGTFREGKIGSWKTHFKPEHKEAFKKIAGQLLIDLGYEKDFNW